MIRLGIIGVGGRGGETYGHWAAHHPDQCSIVAAADPRPERLHRLAAVTPDPQFCTFTDWQDLLAAVADQRLDLDAVIIAAPDALHPDIALAAAQHHVAILLEKPIAPTHEQLETLLAKLTPLNPRIAVAHVLRETPFWNDIYNHKQLLGQLATIRHEENIGFWHFAHSYVRGNWRSSESSSPMALAKTSHDFDLIRWIAEETPSTITSVGNLLHFRPENAPVGAPEFCIHGCPWSAECPYDAQTYYLETLRAVHGWPVALLTDDTTLEGRRAALATSNYGRCVYHSGNDVVDHQQTLMAFPNGVTATLTTSAFTGANTRTLQLTGSRGELTGRMDTGTITVQLYAPTDDEKAKLPAHATVTAGDRTPRHTIAQWPAGTETTQADHKGHAGGDDRLMARFVTAAAASKQVPAGHQRRTFDEIVSTDLTTSVDSHRMAFLAEKSRLSGTTMTLTTD